MENIKDVFGVELKEYEKVVEENNELKTVLRKITHEMGNALTLLGASIYYLESQMEKESNILDINDLKGDYRYICRLFNSLREYNHADMLDKKKISVGDLVEKVEKDFIRIKGNEKVDFSKENMVKNETLYINADLIKLRQVFVNVLKNSMEAMEENAEDTGRKISMRLEKEEDNNEENDEELGREESYIHIVISDNGKGIDEKMLGAIFKPMFTIGKKNGSGLGLAVVKKIVELHQGKIKAVSVQGTGTAIHIYLPLLRD